MKTTEKLSPALLAVRKKQRRKAKEKKRRDKIISRENKNKIILPTLPVVPVFDTYLGRREEDTKPGSDFNTKRYFYYFEKARIGETKLLLFASRYFSIGDKISVENNPGQERIETDNLVFRRRGNTFFADIKNGEQNIPVPKPEYDDNPKLTQYRKDNKQKPKPLRIYTKSRKVKQSENTGSWLLTLTDKTETTNLFYNLKKTARKNKAILNAYAETVMNLDKLFVMRVYCTEKNAMNVRTVLYSFGVTDKIPFNLSNKNTN